MQASKTRFAIIWPLALGTLLAAIYLASMAPGLTWANGGADGGDLITAAATGGVAHPTGYPVYLLMARLFQLMPFGALAWRTNLLSAAATTAAALLVYSIVRRALEPAGPVTAALAGLIGGLGFGLAPLVWSEAVITEVYSLNMLFVAVLLDLLTRTGARRGLHNAAIGLVQGLAVGNQILAGLLIPATLAAIAVQPSTRGAEATAPGPGNPRPRLDLKALRDGFLGLLVGLLVYGILPLRAAAHPPVNWGDPVTMDRFFWLVSGQLYQPELLQFDLARLWQQLQAWAGVMVGSFGVAGLAVGLLGLMVFFQRSRLHLLTLYTAVVFTIFALLYAVVDFRVYLLPVVLCLSIWIGLGIGGLIKAASPRWKLAAPAIIAVCCIYLALLGYRTWPHVNASSDNRAESLGRNIMQTAPARAIVLAQGDRAIFTLWYFQYALRQRPDLAIIATDLLPFDWYQQNLRYTYPDLNVPAQTQELWLLVIPKANPGRPICYVFEGETGLTCP